ncbi:hypothetical protein Tco_1367946 [Tanacetum coccineum]
MPPKRTAVTTTPMTDAQIKALISQGVADALAEIEAIRNTSGDDSHDSRTNGRRHVSTVCECTYTDFLKCQPLNLSVNMDDPNITMEEYIRLDEEKAHRHGKVYSWKTARYGKIWYDENVHDLRSVKTEFSSVVFNDKLTSKKALSCEPTVSPLNNNELDFRISFDESDDEDYTVIFDKNSFFYQIISVDNLKTDSENDNDKVNVPLFPLPEPAHIDEFDLKNETSLSECDEEEQNILYFNDLFPFNVIYPDESKSDKDNDDDKIDIKHSSGGNVIKTDDGAYAQRMQYGISLGLGYGVLTSCKVLAIKKSTIWYTLKKTVLNSYEHADASSTHFCSRTQIGESSRATYQGSSSF